MIEIFKEFKRSYKRGHLYRIYEVSNLGRIKRNGEIIEPINIGYSHIGGFYIHRAVAMLFIPNPENKPCVDHIDTDIYNNKVDNLRWVTPNENLKNPISEERRIKALKGRKMPDNFSEIMSKSKLQLYKEHPELREKLSKAHKGKCLSEETKQKLRNRKVSEETKQKLSKNNARAMQGKKLKDYMTEEAYENWKNNLKGKKAWNKGLHTNSGENNPMYGKGLRVWVNNGKINHLIKKENLNKYLENGYTNGRK